MKPKLCPRSRWEELELRCREMERVIRELSKDLGESGSSGPYSRELDGSAAQEQIDVRITTLNRLKSEMATYVVLDDEDYQLRVYGPPRLGHNIRFFGPENLPTAQDYEEADSYWLELHRPGEGPTVLETEEGPLDPAMEADRRRSKGETGILVLKRRRFDSNQEQRIAAYSLRWTTPPESKPETALPQLHTHSTRLKEIHVRRQIGANSRADEPAQLKLPGIN